MINFFFIFIILNLIIFLNIKKISKFVNIFDVPDKKLKTHKKKTPLIGGTIILLNIFLLIAYQIIFLGKFFFLEKEYFKTIDIIGIFILILSFYLLGLYDDKYNLNPLKKIFLSIILIFISITLNKELIIFNFSLSFYDSRIFLENFSLIFTIFCFIVLMNSLNFYDGINGQSCIYFLVVFSYLLILTKRYEFYGLILIILFFLLVLNLKNQLFLGDNGIYVLSIILSIALIYEHNVYKNIIFADEIFILLLLPGLELIRLTITRLLKGKNPFYGDKDHIHHLLIKRNSLIKTNLILAIITSLPIILFKVLVLDFFLVFIFFLIIYGFIILKMKKNAS